MARGRRVEDDDFVGHGLDLLEHFGKGHGFVHAGNAKGQILHHAAHATQARHGVLTLLRSACQQVLYTAVGVNFHGTEIVEAVDESRVLAELLVEGIREVVGGVGRDEKNRLAVLCELDGEGARCRRLSYTTLSADEYPPERLLVEDGLERGRHVGVDERGRGHVCVIGLWQYRRRGSLYLEEGRQCYPVQPKHSACLLPEASEGQCNLEAPTSQFNSNSWCLFQKACPRYVSK